MKIKDLLDVFKKEDLEFIPAKGFANYKGNLTVEDLQNAEIKRYKTSYENGKVKIIIYFE